MTDQKDVILILSGKTVFFIFVVIAEMILGFTSRYACLGDLDQCAASGLQVACK